MKRVMRMEHQQNINTTTRQSEQQKYVEKEERRQERERSAEKGNWVFMQSVPCSFWFGPKFGFRENSKMTCRAGVLLLRVGEAQLVETR